MDINDGTIGKFYVVGDDGVKIMSGFSLEPVGPDTTTPNKDRRVPKGVYNLEWLPSPKYNKLMPTLYNELVPKSRRILIHQGNYPIDTEGCILLGDSYDNKGVYNSVKTLAKVFALIKDKKIVVEINNLEQ